MKRLTTQESTRVARKHDVAQIRQAVAQTVESQ
jgi:hypothetical protein